MNLKKYSLVLAFVLLSALVLGCAANVAKEPPKSPPIQNEEPAAKPQPKPDKEPYKLSVIALKGPTGMGMVKLMENALIQEANAKYSFSLAAAPDEIVGKIATGEVDIAAAPINLAAALYNKTEGGVAVIAVNTLGVLYILENGDSVQTFSDLSKTKLFATGEGATPEYILNYLLEQNEASENTEIEYMAEHSELATLLAADMGGVKVAMLPEPNATIARQKNPQLRIALDLTEEWNKVSGGTELVQGCIIVRREVLNNNPEAVDAFLAGYKESTAFTNEQQSEAAALIEKFGIIPNAKAAEAAIPRSNIVCITGEEMKQSAAKMLEVLYAANPKSIGGKLPGDEFYYIP